MSRVTKHTSALGNQRSGMIRSQLVKEKHLELAPKIAGLYPLSPRPGMVALEKAALDWAVGHGLAHGVGRHGLPLGTRSTHPGI